MTLHNFGFISAYDFYSQSFEVQAGNQKA